MEQTEVKYHPAVFGTVWSGQMISLLGSGMSEFALGVYLYQTTHSVIQFALLNLFLFLPQVLITPIAGVIADRYNRRVIMILSNLGGALTTGLLVTVVLMNVLQVWLIYVISLCFALCNATLYPPYAASIPLLVRKKHLGRANGMVQFAGSISRTLSPLVAGALIVTIHLQGIALIDGISFLIALGTLLFVVIPQPAATGRGRQSIVKDALAGLNYITSRPGMVGLLIFFGFANISISYCGALFTPLVLSFADSAALGLASATGGAGLVAGSILMIIWGGTRQRIHSILGGGILLGLFISLVGVYPSIVLIACANFCLCFCMPVVNSAYATLMQTKVPPELQGRVFSSLRLVGWSTVPLAFLTAGLLSDQVFEPLLLPHGSLAGSLGRLIGVGAGRGIGFLLILIGLLATISGIVAYLRPRVRLLETEIPDANAKQEVQSAVSA